MRFFFILAVWLLGTLVEGRAHPVAQGAMDFVVTGEAIEVQARVAAEQAFVAETFSAGNSAGGAGLAQLWQRHGRYLLEHLRVAVDGVALSGELLDVTAPETPQPTSRLRVNLRFKFPPAVTRPARISVTQDVLNEFEFAPGNRWEATYVVRLVEHGQASHEGLLLTSKEPLEISCHSNAAAPAQAPLDRRAMFAAYLHHGVVHILSGYDHLLFISALVLAVVSFGDLFKVITAFTVAHSLTLALSVLNIVRLPSHIVEPMIAASIVVVAVQNIFWPHQSRGWSRLLLAFGFGLFHGLGFAGGLLDAMEGLPGVAVVIAILGFSLGVELGHQVVVLPLFGVLQFSRRSVAASPPTRPAMIRYGSAAIAVAGAVYLVAALGAF